MRILIRKGRIIDPSVNLDAVMDLLVEEDRVLRIEENIAESEADQVMDACGCWVVPGFIDLHVHFRDPGLTHKETIATGSCAAAAGGFTTVCVMPNTKPVTDCGDVVRYVHEEAAKTPVTNVLVIGAITKGQNGEELADLDSMAEAGICGLSEDGKSVMNSRLMMEAMKWAAAKGLPILDHCEDMDLAHGCVNACEAADKLGLPGIPGVAEELITARDIQLAKEAGAKLHICHVSTSGSARIIELAKQEGCNVTAEVGPHHFALDDSEILKEDANYKMNPPLRGTADVESMKASLANGVLDCIATDHAPHHESEKNVGLLKAMNGIVGLETSFAVSKKELVDTGILTPLELIRKMSTNPAQVLGIDKGTLQPGAAADIAIIDPDAEYVIDKAAFKSKGHNTPFHGWKVKGMVTTTILGGRIVYKEGQIL